MKVAHLLLLASKPHPLDTKCTHGKYKGWHWHTIVTQDPEWVIWLLVESRVLLPRELEVELHAILRRLTFDSVSVD